ncbi:HNH endonuclease [Comamonas sp.]|uniref:HNH endonuclease n=1 Tax=Comamonas sp. TaxID=34028 RepID=UPI0012CC2A34|nr:HNH endonuclease [Comamonas sp.]MPS93159.1 HNH endonuclease [Comamonas sp.]
MSKAEMNWRFAAVHEYNSWRLASFESQDNAITGSKGAHKLLSEGRWGTPLKRKEEGLALAVLVWKTSPKGLDATPLEEDTSSATVIRPVPGAKKHFEEVVVPIEQIKSFKKLNGPTPAQIDDWFEFYSVEGTEPSSDSQEPSLVEFYSWLDNAQPPLSATEKDALVKVRIGQSAYRRRLLRRWKGCAVTDCREKTLLIASHIKPWSVSTHVERLSVDNGILLSPTLDKAFDAGLISFGDDFKVMLHCNLSVHSMEALHLKADMRLRQQHEGMRAFLKWHRQFHGFE